MSSFLRSAKVLLVRVELCRQIPLRKVLVTPDHHLVNLPHNDEPSLAFRLVVVEQQRRLPTALTVNMGSPDASVRSRMVNVTKFLCCIA